MATKRIRVGLIGSGGQGRYLSEALRVSDVAEFVACADPNPDATAKAVRDCGYQKAYSDPQKMLTESPVDAVIVATTHDQLYPMALAAVKAGKHALVEKPMALNAADGRKLLGTAKKAGVKLMVGYTLRFMPARILMKKLLDSGAIGDVVHIIAGQCIGSMGGWLGDPARGGGPLFYIGTHVLDQVLWVAGRPAERVFAEMSHAKPGGVEGDAMMTVRFPGGTVAHVCTSQRMGGRYGWLDLLGSKGRIHAEWESNVLTIQSQVVDAYKNLTHIEVPVAAYLPAPAAGARASLASHAYIRMWAAELGEFAAAITQGRDPAVTGEDGVRVLQVTDAAFESARSSKPVDVK